MGDPKDISYSSFLGTGWSFPPEFVKKTGTVAMRSDQRDIAESLVILLGTAAGERFLNPKYGLDMHEMLFEPMSTTMKTYMVDRIRLGILIHEPRIDVFSLEVDTSQQHEGVVRVLLEYEVRGTNSRYNLVYPFYLTDASEVGR